MLLILCKVYEKGDVRAKIVAKMMMLYEVELFLLAFLALSIERQDV